MLEEASNTTRPEPALPTLSQGSNAKVLHLGKTGQLNEVVYDDETVILALKGQRKHGTLLRVGTRYCNPVTTPETRLPGSHFWEACFASRNRCVSQQQRLAQVNLH